MTYFRSAPTYDTNLVEKGGNTNKSQYRFFQDLDIGTPPAAETPVTPTGSPFTFQAPRAGYLIVSGGAVSAISFSRTPKTFYPTGQTSGMFSLNLNDNLQIAYSAPPTLIFVPS
jgi:hypothetical protein